MANPSLDIKASSAATATPPGARATLELGKLIDVSRCIGCKACQAACMEWNDLRDTVGTNDGFYTNPADLSDQTWCLMRFNEEEIEGTLNWLILKDGCLHCSDPGCLKACPAPGAIVQYSNGIVDFQEDQCIGCGYCQTGCPFNIPRYSKKDAKAYKCTLCSDRVAVGLEPACIKSCPTQALSFGSKEEMLELANHRLDDLKERGFANASVYDPAGVGGTHVFFVLPHGDRPEAYGLPKDPRLSPIMKLWRGWLPRSLGLLTIFSVLLAAFGHYLRFGPLEVPGEPGSDGKDSDGKGEAPHGG
jgi:formate dehydrogenase iron-sulfur subunit